MKALVTSLLIASAATGSALAVQPNRPAPQRAVQPDGALAAVAAAVAPPGQSSRPVDPDQGDDHASPTAILKVCSKDTPAAQRSAICPVGVSPE